MEHTQMKNSLDSELQIEYIFSVEILDTKKVRMKNVFKTRALWDLMITTMHLRLLLHHLLVRVDDHHWRWHHLDNLFPIHFRRKIQSNGSRQEEKKTNTTR